ncbi:SDR family oxidoreductase [Paenibacillus turicensis]|uniref:SDR family NAD(P)-dependent oxidoreductase n=1 Tax=Paenibacillus turicensis TaxID=160487 RepID=UPI003D270AE5
MSLQSKVVVITGASSGIGADTAKLLSEEGATVILTARSLNKLEAVGSQLQGLHKIFQLDVTNDEQVASVFSQIYEQFGRVDVLINNAGYGVFEYCEQTSMDEYEDMMDVNYLGLVRCTKAVLPHMKASRSGRIVNVASIAGKIATAKSTSYTATKHAVLGFTNALRQEVRSYGISVSSINPGPIDTPFFELADPTGHYVNNVKWMMLKPEVVAKAIVKAARTGKPETNMPRLASIGTKLYHLFPRIADAVSYRMLNKK